MPPKSEPPVVVVPAPESPAPKGLTQMPAMLEAMRPTSLRRSGIKVNPPSIPAALGMAGTAPGAPSFIAGPSTETLQLRSAADELRHHLAGIFATTGAALPRAKSALGRLTAAAAGAEIAAGEGVEINRAAEAIEVLEGFLLRFNPAPKEVAAEADPATK